MMADVDQHTQDDQTQSGVKGTPSLRHVTPELMPPTTMRQLLAVWLGALLVVVLVNLAAKVYLDRFTTNRGYWLIREKWTWLQTMPEAVDWLVLGDSSGNQGVMPQVLEQELGGRAVNLCTIGDLGLVNDAWMLQTYLERFGPPRAVILVHAYDIWQRAVMPSLTTRIPLSPGELELLQPPLRLSLNEKLDVFLARWVPLYSQNRTLSDLAMRLVWSPASVWNLLRSRGQSQDLQLDYGGYMPATEARPEELQRDLSVQLDFAGTTTFTVTQSNEAALQQMLSLARQEGFDLYVANSPIYEGLYADPAFQEYFAAEEGYLRGMDAQSEELHYLGVPGVFPADQMQNTDHVILAAARLYTERLAAAILDLR